LQHLKATTVYDSLRRQILSGALQPGARLVLREVAQLHNTSELPVREALRMLQRDGLVVMIPHAGARVASMTLREVQETYFIRSHLEALATETAADNLRAQDLQALDQALAAMAEAIEHGSGVDYARLNKEFHRLIYGASPYRRLQDLIFNLWDGGAKFQVIFQLRPDRMKASHDEHNAILERLKSKDGKGAAALMLEHKLKVAQTLSDYIALEREVWAS
jgi:DNA-binding GntR family transcriptional regulator